MQGLISGSRAPRILASREARRGGSGSGRGDTGQHGGGEFGERVS